MIRYFGIFVAVIFFVFNQIFFFDLFEISFKVILLLICYILLLNPRRETKQLFLFLTFLIFEILVFDNPGYMTLIILLLEQLYTYIGELFKINFMNIIEYFSYFVIFFYFNEGIFNYIFLLNLVISILFIFLLLIRKYGFTKIFRN